MYFTSVALLGIFFRLLSFLRKVLLIGISETFLKIKCFSSYKFYNSESEHENVVTDEEHFVKYELKGVL